MDTMNKANLAANAAVIAFGALALPLGTLYAAEPTYITNVGFNHQNQIDVQVSLTIPKNRLTTGQADE